MEASVTPRSPVDPPVPPSVGAVRVGKTVTFEIDGTDTPEMRAQIDKLCDGLLSNPVIEDYRFEIEPG